MIWIRRKKSQKAGVAVPRCFSPAPVCLSPGSSRLFDTSMFRKPAAVSSKTLRHEKALALANTLFFGAPKFVLAVNFEHVSSAKVIEIQKALTAGLKGSPFSFRGVPHSVARRVVTGTPFAPLLPLLGGKVRLLVTTAPVATAQVAAALAQKYPSQFMVLGGCYAGSPLNQAMLKSIAALPADDTERVRLQFGQLLGLMRNPAFHLYRSLQSHSLQLGAGLHQIKLLKEKEAKASATAPATPATPATSA